jgi:hypothetical protein
MKEKNRVTSETGTKSRSSSGDASQGQDGREPEAETFAASDPEPAGAAKPPIGTGPKIRPRHPHYPTPPIGTGPVVHKAADGQHSGGEGQDATKPPIGTGPILVPPVDTDPKDRPRRR